VGGVPFAGFQRGTAIGSGQCQNNFDASPGAATFISSHFAFISCRFSVRFARVVLPLWSVRGRLRNVILGSVSRNTLRDSPASIAVGPLKKEIEQQVQAEYRQCQEYRASHRSPPFERGEPL
jgi:hypothetical protein